MICLARYSHKRDTSNLVSTDGSYGGAAFNQEQYDAEQAIAAAQQHLEQLEKNRLKKKPQASCVTGVTEAGWSELHICAMGSLNDVECAQILLEAGVSPLVPVWKSTSVSGARHFSVMTRPCWLRRAVRNRHRHAIEQVSRRWRGCHDWAVGEIAATFDFHTG